MADTTGLRHLSLSRGVLVAAIVLAMHTLVRPGLAARAQTGVVIRLSPAETVAAAGDMWTMAIVIDAGSQPVNGVDVCLTFDPEHLAVVDSAGQPVSSNALVPGSALPLVIMNEADNTLGRILYSAGILSTSVSGQIHVASVRFKAKTTPPLGGSAITFSRETTCDTIVAGPGGVPVLDEAQNAVVYSTTVVLPLAEGWNLISFPYAPSNPTLPAPLGSIAGHYSLVYAYDPSRPSSPWLAYRPTLGYGNQLSSVSLQAGYWIRVTSPVTLTYSAPFPGATEIPLQTGWNLIGYPSHRIQAIADALSPIAGKYDAVYAYNAWNGASPWLAYWPGPPERGELQSLTPGRGYWIHMTSPATLRILD